MSKLQTVGGLVFLALFLIAGCGSQESAADEAAAIERPVVVATTTILGDVLSNLAARQFDVVTIMPPGTDPHLFQPSAQDIAAIESASAVIANGALFEEGLLDALNAAEDDGALVFEAITAVDQLEASGSTHDHEDGHDDDHHVDDEDHDEHADDAHGDEDEHGDDGEHDAHGNEGALDPHFFTDPARMAVAVNGIADFLIANVDTLNAEKLTAAAEEYIEVLTALDREVETTLASIPESGRVLITNHQVFSYFADRYDFEVIGTVIPVGSTDDGVSGRRLVELSELLESEGVSVVFADISSSDELAQTLANEVGDVAVVKLYTESLGEPGSSGATYVEMIRNNALEIASGLGE